MKATRYSWTLEDAAIAGAAVSFIAGQKAGHLSKILIFSDFLAVRETAEEGERWGKQAAN